jgi:hypothetical protein
VFVGIKKPAILFCVARWVITYSYKTQHRRKACTPSAATLSGPQTSQCPYFQHSLMKTIHDKMGRNSVVCTATCYGTDGPGIESRCKQDFPLPFRLAMLPRTRPASCTMGTGSISRGHSGRNVALTTHLT